MTSPDNWLDASAVAVSLCEARAWRFRLARAVRVATGARFAGVLTCPPGKVLEARSGVDPEEFFENIERIALRFLARIERAGEGWESKYQLGPYLPLESAEHAGLADLVRAEVLAPMGASTLVNTFLMAPGNRLVGWIIVGDESEPQALLQRCLPLGELAPKAAATLIGALDLAEACGGGLPRPKDPALESLTDRESQVLRLLGVGLKDGEIAEQLGISEQTVGTHLRRVFEKLQVHTRAAAVARAR